MFVELHMLQNFAPSNLNRDDTGAPKDCEFGGVRRGRISSQCLKRAVRTEFKRNGLLPETNLAARTKRIVDEVITRLGEPEEDARPIVESILGGIEIQMDAKDRRKTQYLLYLGEAEIAALVELCRTHWDELRPNATPGVAAEDRPAGTRDRSNARDAKKAGRAAVPREISNALLKALDGGKAADLALFGRMLADLPERNIDAACQVAHALSTNKIDMEFDFYTAVDDLKPDDTAGADMIGTVEFNSACFYRYANVDLRQLETNLRGDRELALATLRAFISASVRAVPTGKQNSMAAQNPPSLVFAVVREAGLWSLANAFVRPVWAGRDGDMIQRSIGELDGYWGKLTKMYGEHGIHGRWVSLTEEDTLQHLAAARVESVDELIENVLATVSGEAA